MKRRFLGLVVAALLASGCGDAGADRYSDETESAFMASCVPTTVKGEEELCECIYTRMEEELSFEEFEEIDRRLHDDEDAELPDDVSDLVMDCAAEGREESTTTTMATTTTEATTTTVVP